MLHIASIPTLVFLIGVATHATEGYVALVGINAHFKVAILHLPAQIGADFFTLTCRLHCKPVVRFLFTRQRPSHFRARMTAVNITENMDK